MKSYFKRLLRPKPSDVSPVPTPVGSDDSVNAAPIDADLSSVEIIASDSSPHFPTTIPHLIVGAAQSVGIQRDHNEDSLFILTTHFIEGDQFTNLGLYMVADGMGGHENGEIASKLATEILSAYALKHFLLPFLSTDNASIDQSIQEILQAGIAQAHAAIKRETQGGGTTLTAALILGDQLTIAHIGDSRAYLAGSNQHLKVLTKDHTLVKRLEEIGQITADEALIHPHRNVLYRSVGQGEEPVADIASYHIQPGDQLLLCTDGLWGVVSDPDLQGAITASVDPQQICQALVNAANSAGGPDNISVIFVRIVG